MTTGTELHDLLVGEAGGPTIPSGGWDDVVRRGRRRQRRRRAQVLSVVAIAASVTVATLVLSADDLRVDSSPTVTQPGPTVPKIDPSTVLHGDDVRIYAARTQDRSVKLFFWDTPQVCSLRPLVAETAGEITVGLVGEQDERGVPWTDCGAAMSGHFGTVELGSPVGDRSLIDLSTERKVPVTDGADLLFPTSLPAPFDPDVFDEGNGRTARMSPVHNNSVFRFVADGARAIYLTSDTDLNTNGTGCDGGQTIQLRGSEGCFVRDEDAAEPEEPRGSYLSWDENGRALSVAFFSSDPADRTLEVLLAIADGLEPLDG